MEKYNSMVFDTETNENALELAQNFLKNLLEHNIKSTDNFADIHIYQEESLIVVEWVQIFYGCDFPQDHFEFLDSEHAITKEIIMPDNSLLYITNDEDEDKIIKDWYKNNPDYTKQD